MEWERRKRSGEWPHLLSSSQFSSCDFLARSNHRLNSFYERTDQFCIPFGAPSPECLILIRTPTTLNKQLRETRVNKALKRVDGNVGDDTRSSPDSWRHRRLLMWWVVNSNHPQNRGDSMQFHRLTLFPNDLPTFSSREWGFLLPLLFLLLLKVMACRSSWFTKSSSTSSPSVCLSLSPVADWPMAADLEEISLMIADSRKSIKKRSVGSRTKAPEVKQTCNSSRGDGSSVPLLFFHSFIDSFTRRSSLRQGRMLIRRSSDPVPRTSMMAL